MARPVFYYDIASAYSWLGAERVRGLIPDAEWRPIFLGGLFKLNGRASWFLGPERDAHKAEIEERVARYGLPSIRWPSAWPASLLDLARAATVARRAGRAAEFALPAFRAYYVEGSDPSLPAEMERLFAAAGVEPREALQSLGTQAVKDELRLTTEELHAAGAPGVPTVVVGDQVFWGDDRLEEAAKAAPAGG